MGAVFRGQLKYEHQGPKILCSLLVLVSAMSPILGAPLIGITGLAIIPPTAAALPIVAIGIPASAALGLAGIGAATSSYVLPLAALGNLINDAANGNLDG